MNRIITTKSYYLFINDNKIILKIGGKDSIEPSQIMSNQM